MAKNGGAVKKLSDKAKANAVKFRKGNAQSILSRVSENYQGGRAGRVVALKAHNDLIANGINPGPAKTFRGDGLPNEGYDIGDDGKFVGLKPKASMAARAEKDKRNSLRSEWREGYVIKGFGRKGRSVRQR